MVGRTLIGLVAEADSLECDDGESEEHEYDEFVSSENEFDNGRMCSELAVENKA